jgi:hypothetical protein
MKTKLNDYYSNPNVRARFSEFLGGASLNKATSVSASQPVFAGAIPWGRCFFTAKYSSAIGLTRQASTIAR